MVRQLRRFKFTHPNGSIEEQVIWSVPRSPRQPEGCRYRLVYVRPGVEAPAVLYDNHYPKGHHKHIRGKQYPYDFVGINKLIEDFKTDVQKENENL